MLPDVEFLTTVRTRAVRLASAALAVMALAAAVGVITSYVGAQWAIVDLFERARDALGIDAPGDGRDWPLLAVMALTLAIPFGLLVLGARFYRRLWSRRLDATWGGDVKRRLLDIPRRPDQHRQVQHLRALLNAPGWAGEWERWSGESTNDERRTEWFRHRDSPDALTAEDYREAVPAVMDALHRDVADRALVAGLAVGLSQQRAFDHLAIVAGSLELQMHVLARLGKKPNLRTWRTMARYCGASLFVNHYVDREDAYGVRFAIRSAAMGFEAMAKLFEEAGDALDHVDMDELVDDVVDVIGLDRAGVVPTALRLLGTSAVLGTGAVVGVGQVGLHQVAELTRTVGDDLLQGVLAASILYFHGMGLAADVLAVDEAHRRAIAPTMAEVLPEMRSSAGRLARKQVVLLRKAYVTVRRDAYKRLPEESRHAMAERFARRRAGSGSAAETGEQA